MSDTSIFARIDGPRQAIVYAMSISADEDLAMVLPLPTPANSPESAVQFVSLESYPRFFDDMALGFPQMEAAALSEPGRAAPQPKLRVHKVGAFDASFVPTQDDFERLDERFRIPKAVWSTIPQYDDYGFAVFKLREGEKQKVHPMAFWFPTRHPDRIFFPTVHIHDGHWTPRAGFDHALYCQIAAGNRTVEDLEMGWEPSSEQAKHFMRIQDTQDLVVSSQHVYRRTVWGELPNEDIVV